MDCELSQQVLELEQAGAAWDICGDSKMWAVAEDLPSQVGQHIARPNLDKDPSTDLIHRFHFVAEANRPDEVLR
jgi:hypothetical protein